MSRKYTIYFKREGQLRAGSIGKCKICDLPQDDLRLYTGRPCFLDLKISTPLMMGIFYLLMLDSFEGLNML